MQISQCCQTLQKWGKYIKGLLVYRVSRLCVNFHQSRKSCKSELIGANESAALQLVQVKQKYSFCSSVLPVKIFAFTYVTKLTFNVPEGFLFKIYFHSN